MARDRKSLQNLQCFNGSRVRRLRQESTENNISARQTPSPKTPLSRIHPFLFPPSNDKKRTTTSAAAVLPSPSGWRQAKPDDRIEGARGKSFPPLPFLPFCLFCLSSLLSFPPPATQKKEPRPARPRFFLRPPTDGRQSLTTESRGRGGNHFPRCISCLSAFPAFTPLRRGL